MSEESPTRPGVLLSVPPVEVAAARLPRKSRATAPTVSWIDAEFESPGRKPGLLGRNGRLRALVVVQDGCVEIEAGEGFVGEAGSLAGLSFGEAFTLAVQDQFGVVDEGHAVREGKLLGAGANEVDVGALFKDEPGSLDGIAETLDAGHAASLHSAAVHEEGVELNAAVGGQKAAAAGVEGGVVFEDGDGCFDGIDSGSAERENGIAGFKRVADTGLVGLGRVGRDGPCAAVERVGWDRGWPGSSPEYGRAFLRGAANPALSPSSGSYTVAGRTPLPLPSHSGAAGWAGFARKPTAASPCRSPPRWPWPSVRPASG